MRRRYDPMKRALLALLKRGEITPAEAAELAGKSRQAVHEWCRVEGIDWRRARLGWLTRTLRREMRRGIGLIDSGSVREEDRTRDGRRRRS